MNVIDALVVSFGLDTKEFAKGSKDIDAGLKNLREKSTKYAKETEEQNKRAAESFSSIRTEVLGLLAAVAGAVGLKDLIFGSINSGAALGRLALNLSMSTQRLDAWDTAARDVGETADGVAASMQNIASGLAKVATGDVSYLTAGRQYGLSLNAKGTPEQAALAIAAKMQQFDAEGHRQWAIGLAQAMGIATPQTFLSKGLTQNLNTYESRSGATPQFVAQQAAQQKNLAELQQRLDAIKDRILVKLGPILEKLATQLANFLDTTNWDKVIAKASVWLGYVGQVVDALGGVKGILIEIAAYKALVLFGNVAMSLVRIGMLTKALFGLRTAAVAATAAEGAAAAGGVAPVAAGLGRGALGVGIAAGSGWWLGSKLYDKLFAGNNAGDQLGRLEAGFLASFGDKKAQGAIDRMEGRAPVGGAAGSKALPSTRADDNIELFNPSTANAAGPSTKQLLTKASRKNAQAQAMQYFISQGWTPAQASGMVANIDRESGFNSSILGDQGTAYGVGQWHAKRQADFKAFTGHDIHGSTLAEQLAFYSHELKGGNDKLAALGGQLLRGTQDPFAAGAIVSKYGERPLDVFGEQQNRGGQASQIYLDYLRSGQLAAANQSTVNHSTSTAQTHIGTVVVNTKATDAHGIARDMRTELANNTVVSQSDTGMN